ncbi:hypothetical protein QBC38DRAFT_126105 [Podospora fimiseda]|uniref:VASt domain-containing protein n=1 Tax=Podospora fimiseda TaxID=252190 RepID=A0AAN6YMX9_9PEZI|nr:hypothetical protein QBC38DRAFT_126105 [Podospora fimiseda]
MRTEAESPPHTQWRQLPVPPQRSVVVRPVVGPTVVINLIALNTTPSHLILTELPFSFVVFVCLHAVDVPLTRLNDFRSNTRPAAISPHPSQIGHLTTSSPLVQAAYNPETQPLQLFRSESLPLDDTDSLSSTSSSLRKTRTGTFTLIPDSDRPKRNTSTNRLKDVFRSKKSSEKGSSDEKSIGEQSSPTPPPRARTAAPENEPKTSTGRSRRLSRGPKLELLSAPPTPPQPLDGPAPLIVNTPPTPTEPQSLAVTAVSGTRSAVDASPVGNMISQRRRAGSGAGPSKLSTITPAPLTPTPEKAESAPGPVSPNPTSTFFSSMFTAVQNTANNLSNSITNSTLAPGQANKTKNASASELNEEERERDQLENVQVESSTSSLPETSTESKEPAVKTLGMGDLSLSQLGIPDPASASPSPVASRFADTDTRHRSESAPTEPNANDHLEDPHLARPRSLHEPGSGDRTPPAGSVYEGKTGGVHRSGSIRSALGHRRKRGSSIATHNTTASAIVHGAANVGTSLTNPSVTGSTAKLTGFAVANKKRNRDFHLLFKSVPDEDYLIDDYSCALQREILAHGRLYISEGHLCFSSNILGWVTTLVMSFDEIVAVEKRSTALVFKNGLEISTLHAKHIFASFATRDTTYDLIIKIWKLGHPQLQSSLNGVTLEEPGGDRTVKIETTTEAPSIIGSNHSISGSDDDSDNGDDVYDEDEEDEDDQEAPQPSDDVSDADKAAARKVSGAAGALSEKVDDAAPAAGGDFPGPTSHAPTDCGDLGSHYEKILGDETIPAPLGKVYNLLFGPGSADWMGKFITNDQKCMELTMEDKSGLTDAVKSRTFTYIKPLGGSIGPKQTKCIVTEQLENIDLEKSVNVLCSTQNPDVPNGNIFVVKTRYCLTWGENDSTRIQVNCTIEWSGKSWLKGPIERGANEGQTQYCKDLFTALRSAVSSRTRAGTGANAVGSRKKRSRKSKSALASNPVSDNEGPAAVSTKQSWGIFEPARPILGPVVATVSPIITGNVVYGLLVGLLVASWFGFGTRQGVVPYGMELGYMNYPQRMAAYEEMWRREESDLWDWIEQRAGLDRLNADPPLRKRTVNPRTLEEKLREERMDERELREAIRVTEEHLQVLKSVIEKGSGGEKA